MNICDKNKKRVKRFLILSFLGLILINFTLVGAYIIFTKYGSLTLNPGEKYTVNIPFIGPSKSPVICGTAQQTDGIPLENIKVIVKYYNNDTLLAQNITDSNGKYCITFPEITSYKKFDIYTEYDNETIILGSNDYDLNFDNNKIYNKNSDKYVFLTGNIINEDARIENGRIEIKVGYLDPSKNNSVSYRYGDYQKFYGINIAPNEEYEITEDLNISWGIPYDDAPAGKYKILIKTSFNAKEHPSSVFFNITE